MATRPSGPGPGEERGVAGGRGDPVVALLGGQEASDVATAHGVPQVLARLNVFRALLRRPPVAAGLSSLLLALLAGDGLDPRLRELAIMRVAWTHRSVYEWTQHWHIATGMGVPVEDLLAVRDDPVRQGPTEQAVLSAVDDVGRDGRVGPSTMAELQRHLSEEEVIEVVAVIGAWSMVAVLLDSLGVPLEEGVDPWPPDGRRPG